MVLGIRERLDSFLTRSPAGGRRPRDWKIDDFIGDRQGVDDVTTSTITMYHKGDSVTLVNSYDGVEAFFEVKYVGHFKVEAFWITISEKTEEDVKEFSLTPGASQSFTLDEGTLAHMGVGKAGWDVDIFITLIKVEEMTATGETKTSFIKPGQNVLLFDVIFAGERYRPAAVIDRVRKKRMIIGGLGPKRVFPAPGRRQNIVDMTRAGKISNPIQAGMIYTADTYEDARENVRSGLRLY